MKCTRRLQRAFLALAGSFALGAIAMGAALADEQPAPPLPPAGPNASPSTVPTVPPATPPSPAPMTDGGVPTPPPGGAAMPPSTTGSAPNAFDGNVHTTLIPYVWLPNINGTLRFSLPPNNPLKTIDFKAGPNNYLADLHFGILAMAEVRKGLWSGFGDFMYLNMSTDKGTVVDAKGPFGRIEVPITLGGSVRVTNTVWELEASRTLAHGSAGFFDVNAGARGIYSTVGATWNIAAGQNQLLAASGSVSTNATIVDGIIGFHGRLNLGSPRWSIPYYGDFGWGSGNTTAQEWFGIAYGANQGQTLNLVYRNMAYYMTGDGPFQSFRFGGPAIGYAFKI